MEVLDMSGYTIEDIDLLRKKSGISYEEAIALLEYHNGNLAQALIDLERNGKIKREEPQQKKKKPVLAAIYTLYCMRLKIRKDDVPIVNFSLIFCVLCAVFAPYLSIFGCVLALILGYRFSFSKHDKDFEKDDLESKFHHAADNVRSSLSGMAKGFTENMGSDTKKEDNQSESYYSRTKTSTVPEMKVPKRVDSTDGSVRFEEESDGYSSATIE